MSLLAWYAVLGVVQAALGVWVIVGQPRRVLNWAVGSFLMLWAGSGIVFQLYREAASPAAALPFLIVGDLYDAPTFFLILLVVDRLMLATPKPRGWNWLLGACGVGLVFLLAGHATTTLAEPRTELRVINAMLNGGAQILAILLAGRMAMDVRARPLLRRQAAFVGLAFGLLLAQTAGAAISMAIRGTLLFDASSPLTALSFLGLACVLTTIYAIGTLAAAFRGGPRTAVRVSLGLSLLVGIVSHLPTNSVFEAGGRVIALSAFSLLLAVAVLRYGLIGNPGRERLRLQGVSTVLLVLAVGAIVTVAVLSLANNGLLGIGLGVVAIAVPVAVLVPPVRRLPAWVTRRVLLHPRDPEALHERVRMYASTLHAATGPDGRIIPSTEAALAALRNQLGLGQRDHDLLVAMGGDQAAGGIVAYRLAIVGAAADAEIVDLESLRDLREQLGLTERDHAMVLEHVRAGADNLAVGTLFLGRYHVLRRLDDGGLAEVWLARDNRSQTEVVVKHLAPHEARDAAALKRIRQEVDSARMLEHPNIVAVRGVEAIGSETYLVMEHMAGGSLAQRLQREGKMAEPDVVRFATDIMAALVALHGRSIVHRDVKPGNILFDETGVAKLGDFNIARELISGVTLGNDGNRPVVGTFAYMPLDQARGMAPSPQHDLHALAATMYEALAGAPLLGLSGLSHAEAIGRIAERPPVIAVPHASPRLAALLSRALGRTGQPDSETMLAELKLVGKPASSVPPRPRHLA